MSRRFDDIPATPIAGHPGAPLLQRAGNVVRITLNRPAEHNRIDPADVDALLPLLAGMHQSPPRALVLAGTGERTFSSGYTLSAIVEELDSRFERMLDLVETLPCPTIAAIGGGVYGGATDLALCCDLRIGVPGIRMFVPAARFGLHYYPGGLRRYVTRLGLSAASRLMLTATTIDADEMLRIGFLGEIVERAALEDRIEARLAEIDQTEPKVVAQMKAHLIALAQRRADEPEAIALQASMARATEESLRSPELRARLAARLGK